jgi:hypothetical protein
VNRKRAPTASAWPIHIHCGRCNLSTARCRSSTSFSSSPPGADDLASRTADDPAKAQAVPEGRLWVRVHALPPSPYAENGAVQAAGELPVFVDVLLGSLPAPDELARHALAVASAVSGAVQRPRERVHVEYAPAGRGRVAFGGHLVGWPFLVLPEIAGMSTGRAASGESASQLIDARIAELGDWRGGMLARLRALIRQADPGVIEEWKWNVPVWSYGGLICTGETYKSAVKLTFAKGASLPDPSGLFNASLEGKVRRAIDFHAGDAVDAPALKALVLAAVAANRSAARD